MTDSYSPAREPTAPKILNIEYDGERHTYVRRDQCVTLVEIAEERKHNAFEVQRLRQMCSEGRIEMLMKLLRHIQKLVGSVSYSGDDGDILDAASSISDDGATCTCAGCIPSEELDQIAQAFAKR